MIVAQIPALLVEPFADYAFMRRALVACLVLAIGGTPLGVFMSLRRMTLVGDALSHAILPGVALAFGFFGFAVWPMTIGGGVIGVLAALLALFLTRVTQLKEDSSFTLVYLSSLAFGVVLVSVKGNSVDLMHLLFGNILAIDDQALYLIGSAACVSLLCLAVFYRALVLSCFDPDFANAAMGGRNHAPLVFFVLLVVNLIAAFQALGTLMALGVIILPALAARFWTKEIDRAVALSVLLAFVGSPIGLLISYYAEAPSGPSVVLALAVVCFVSAFVGKFGSVRAYCVGNTTI